MTGDVPIEELIDLPEPTQVVLGEQSIGTWELQDKGERWFLHEGCDGQMPGVKWWIQLTPQASPVRCVGCRAWLPTVAVVPPGPPRRPAERSAEKVDRIAEMAERLEVDHTVRTPVEGKPWMSHAEFLEKDHAACQRMVPKRRSHRDLTEFVAKERLARYVREHGSEDGYEPLLVPCGGMMMIPEDEIVDSEMAGLGAHCSTCNFGIGLKRESFDPHYLLRRQLGRSGIPERYLGKRMTPVEDQAQARDMMREYVLAWMAPSQVSDLDGKPVGDPGPPLRLPVPMPYGDAGRGKTHLLCSVAETLIRKYGADVAYWPIADLLAKVKTGFSDTKPELRIAAQEAWERARTVELLVLDDIGAERPTEWAREQIQTLIDYRYGEELPILTASNIPPSLWEEYFGPRTASRLNGMTAPIEVGGDDLRQEGSLAPVVDMRTGEIRS